jgi:transposase
MISFSGRLKIFLLVSSNGLYGLVSTSFDDDPRSGALYVFCNRRHTPDQGALFRWDGPLGLEQTLRKGTFRWPKPGQLDSPKLNLTLEAFAMLTDGVDLRRARRAPGVSANRERSRVVTMKNLD